MKLITLFDHRGPINTFVIQPSAVGGTQIFDHPEGPILSNSGVTSRNANIPQDHSILFASAKIRIGRKHYMLSTLAFENDVGPRTHNTPDQ
ncbi:MAG: hypothetical protein Q8O00_10305 [Holophaga sp.]|nr:hypothetical protein [Holophaga sp.]